LIIAAILGGIGLGLFLAVRHAPLLRSNEQPSASLPEIAKKPEPLLRSFGDCPPEGDGGDPELNELKNRTDDGQYFAVPLEVVERLDWPKGIERRHRSHWSAEERQIVARFEGLPLSIEGFVAGVRLEGPESPNCHNTDLLSRDLHIWVTSTATKDRSDSIIVEITPAFRAKHPNWTIEKLELIEREHYRVRVSGWLLLDPDHPDQVGKTRGTIWEVHPVTNFDIQKDGQWLRLENLIN
jgi:hypothetical protein